MAIMNELSLSKAYRFLEPGPVVLVTTAYEGGTNIITMSYHMMIQDSSVPLIGCGIGPWDHSFTALCATGECVIAMPLSPRNDSPRVPLALMPVNELTTYRGTS
jgi:flavin reductase (DIM6/NTAB) family NADH-FMN oxidoreductase RutF